MSRQKYQKPLHVDVPFEEALQRFANVDPQELEGAFDDVPIAAAKGVLRIGDGD
jgi:hypothetical protein